MVVIRIRVLIKSISNILLFEMANNIKFTNFTLLTKASELQKVEFVTNPVFFILKIFKVDLES